MQAEFDLYRTKDTDKSIAVRAYVPSFLAITARDIEQWAHGNLKARSALSVLLRKLIHSTGEQLSHVDFPGYDNAEKKAWDGRVDAGAATPWIPLGQSGWEFGCDKDPARGLRNRSPTPPEALSHPVCSIPAKPKLPSRPLGPALSRYLRDLRTLAGAFHGLKMTPLPVPVPRS